MTVLMHEPRRGTVDIVRPLIESGANINIQDKHGKTALYKAWSFGYTEIVEALKSARATE